MDLRAHVYSPTQNAAIWWAAWLYHQQSFDALSEALEQLGGLFTTPDGQGLTELAAYVRRHAELDKDQGRELGLEPHHPRVELLLAGPGNTHDAGQTAAIAILNAQEEAMLLTPKFLPEVTLWESEMHGPLRTRAFLSPGDADALLTQATNTAAQLIESMDHGTSSHANPRLTVGTLQDFYENPAGLPPEVPPRAGKLIARADRVAAIVETVVDRLGDHTFDPELLGLGRPIRLARMAAVSYCCAEWGRLRG
ncbi:hypothetical protein NQ015_05440 [Corynebacterium sp. 153RC1]|uniref:hypothetical protein n=1 Tax=unclassified Corynebacterium TaxID=2624378 RepID=UPI00211C386D|nr:MULTISPECIES: hypothetical protein [unclassified Corynebacterium]MCQ9369751.1 hypothetical protein [Corynebacterium sp. 35RC1]MCQ9352410.1 hypothetical protein [Corynebacterium sp. 209RC1]MCQ9354418.1 hypothetical protein [Corynebacterium sp. 1222RC1]MCQ9356693.1 hypothetical protein [Corynebacterium sp. 122RC1]MCQ9358813.1 hypothetical protein [Corynebacterium sp. 142RC1]